MHRVRDAWSNAQTARYKANANQLQLAYERTKFAYPGMLTNENIGLFAANAANAGFFSATLSVEDLAHIGLAPGTSISGQTALFILRTNDTDDHGQLLCPQAGFKVPVAITRAAWAKTVEAGGIWKPTDDGETLELKGGQSLTGRLWDVLWMLKLASGRASHTDRVHFQVLVDVQGDGRRELVKLWAHCGPGDDARPVLTIMLEGED